MKKILVFSAYYLPGYKGGGPIRCIENTVKALENDFEFSIVTSDRDLGDKTKYQGIENDKWTQLNGTEIYYSKPGLLSLFSLIKTLKNKDFDLFYFNSFFSWKFTILPLILIKMRLLRNKSIVLAPRGEFSDGALNLKSNKKKLFIKLSRILGLYKNILWQASSNFEVQDIENQIGKYVEVKVAPEIPSYIEDVFQNKRFNKNVGEVRLIFLSRISPKKNLIGALELLRKVKGRVIFSIFGPIEDKVYWGKCQNIISGMPNNIKVIYEGSIDHNSVYKRLAENHFFFLPTHGENFGYVIIEALTVGCPVIISDQTPWRSLEEKGCGWDLSLDSQNEIISILERCVGMDKIQYEIMSTKAYDYGKQYLNNDETIKKTQTLFNHPFLNKLT